MSLLCSEPRVNFEVKLTRASLELMIRRILARKLMLPEDDILLESNLADLGLDSLDLAELFFVLEDQLLRTIPLDQNVRLKTVGDAVALAGSFVDC